MIGRQARDAAAEKLRLFYLWSLYGLAAVAGVRVAILPTERSLSGALWNLAVGLLLALVLRVDAEVLGKRLPQSAGWLILFFWPIAAPGCVIALRRWRGLGIVLGHGALLLLVGAAVASGVSWLAG